MRVETSQTDNEKKGGVRLGLHVICELVMAYLL